MNAIARRIKRLENLKVQQQAEAGPDLVAVILERRRRRAIAEGREPEALRSWERSPEPPLNSRLSLADVILQARKRRLALRSIERKPEGALC